jgi:hypothetical protein
VADGLILVDTVVDAAIDRAPMHAMRTDPHAVPGMHHADRDIDTTSGLVMLRSIDHSLWLLRSTVEKLVTRTKHIREFAEALPPLGSPERLQSVTSTEVQGLCVYCRCEVLAYEPVAGCQPLNHWVCYVRAGRPGRAPAMDAVESTQPTDDERHAYRGQIAAIKTTTLYAMLREYEQRPEERTSDMAWQIEVVRDEYSRRPDAPTND